LAEPVTEAEIFTVVKWVDADAPEGNLADLPKATQHVDG
jgi:hypothetical protein